MWRFFPVTQKILEGGFLIGHARGSVFAYKGDLNQYQALQIKKSLVPSGILHFTLFDGLGRPHSERLIFNDWAYESSMINGLDLKNAEEHMELLLQLDTILVDKQLDLSASIVDKAFQTPTLENGDIRSHLLMNSDLSRKISYPAYYLTDIDRRKRYFLDLMIRCQEWRRFTWKDLDLQDGRILQYPMESGYSIDGYTTKEE